MKSNIAVLPDALREALGQVIANERREWRRERELIEAQAQAAIADLKTQVVELRATLNESISERLASLKDGRSVTIEDVSPLIVSEVGKAVALIPKPKDGEDADPALVERLVQAEVAKLPPPKEIDRSVLFEAINEVVADAVSAIPKPRDGEPGKSVSLDDVRPLIDRAIAALPPPKDGEPGKSVSLDDVKPLLLNEVEKAVAALPKPQDGKSVSLDELAPLVERAVAALPPPQDGKSVGLDDVKPFLLSEIEKAVSALPKPKDGEPGKDVDPEAIEKMVAKAVAALPPAKDGAPGKLPIVKEWEERVYYAGDVVTFDGATFQAERDTGKQPPHDDWRCIAARGTDGRSFNIRGTWSETAEYRHLDVVALGGASFAAKKDNPGACPGDGWQLMAQQGKMGKPGERGLSVKGDAGKPGPALSAAQIDDEGLLVLTNADGSKVSCDFYPVLSKVAQS